MFALIKSSFLDGKTWQTQTYLFILRRKMKTFSNSILLTDRFQEEIYVYQEMTFIFVPTAQ